jgi:hypothetical protein
MTEPPWLPVAPNTTSKFLELMTWRSSRKRRMCVKVSFKFEKPQDSKVLSDFLLRARNYGYGVSKVMKLYNKSISL